MALRVRIGPQSRTTRRSDVIVMSEGRLLNLGNATKAQAEYLGIDVAGPYKTDHYRY